MAKLVNVFSWSHSAAHSFEDCPRRRYWSKYAKWHGWERGATPEQKQAYRLDKMNSRHTLKGDATEMGVMWMIKEAQLGRDPTPEQAFEQVKGFLRRSWDESLQGTWKTQPKKCCLHEHYYPQFSGGVSDRDRIIECADAVKTCLTNFKELFFERFQGIDRLKEIPVTVVGMGDPEHFEYEGVKIYAIPDYVWRDGDTWHIHDWKSGKPRPEHANQLRIYALWAQVKHGVSPENIQVHLEYLHPGETTSAQIKTADLEEIREYISTSVGDMAAYLIQADIKANQPIAKEEWDMTPDRDLCRHCPFYEMCEPDFED